MNDFDAPVKFQIRLDRIASHCVAEPFLELLNALPVGVIVQDEVAHPGRCQGERSRFADTA